MNDTQTPIEQAIEALGGPTKAAEKLGVSSPSVVLNWRLRNAVPPRQAIAIESITGIPRHKLCPSVFGAAA